MRLSVCTPVLNEEMFISIWLDEVARYADEIVVLDGGSTDQTILKLQKAASLDSRIKFQVALQTGLPYSEDWNENVARNRMIDMCTGDAVLVLDVDEVLSDNFYKDMIEPDKVQTFRSVPFWRNINTVRLAGPSDNRWLGVTLHKIFPKGYRCNDKKHHCVIDCPLPLQALPCDLFHLHYAFETFGHKPKFRDNRRAEIGAALSDNPDLVDWDYVAKHPEHFEPGWKVVTMPYGDKHPQVLKKWTER